SHPGPSPFGGPSHPGPSLRATRPSSLPRSVGTEPAPGGDEEKVGQAETPAGWHTRQGVRPSERAASSVVDGSPLSATRRQSGRWYDDEPITTRSGFAAGLPLVAPAEPPTALARRAMAVLSSRS